MSCKCGTEKILCKNLCSKCYNREYQRKYIKTEKDILAKKKYRKENKQDLYDRHKKWVANNRDKKREYDRKDREKHPLKIKARSKVAYLIRKGVIPKPSELVCVCGKQAKEYHHKDYSKPLEVVPLCVLCHKGETIKNESETPIQ